MRYSTFRPVTNTWMWRNCFVVGLATLILIAKPISGEEDGEDWYSIKSKIEQLHDRGEYKAAIQLTERSLPGMKAKYGPDDLRTAEAIGTLGALYDLSGEEQRAQPYYREARRIRLMHGSQGLPLGIETKARFHRIAERRAQLAASQREHGLQSASHMAPVENMCDLNEDTKCDEMDEKRLMTLNGKCQSNLFERSVDSEYRVHWMPKKQVDPAWPGLFVRADFDHDGCITDKDQKVLQQIASGLAHLK